MYFLFCHFEYGLFIITSDGISQKLDFQKTATAKLQDKNCAKFEFVKPNNFLTRSPRAKSLTYYHQHIEN